jgi:hypothetical protein
VVVCFAIAFPLPSKEVMLVNECIRLSPLFTANFWKLVIAKTFSFRLKWQINLGYEDHKNQRQLFWYKLRDPTVWYHISSRTILILSSFYVLISQVDFFFHFLRPKIWTPFLYLLCNVRYINGPCKQIKWNVKVYTVRMNSRSHHGDKYIIRGRSKRERILGHRILESIARCSF